jgi:hypothetical protein
MRDESFTILLILFIDARFSRTWFWIVRHMWNTSVNRAIARPRIDTVFSTAVKIMSGLCHLIKSFFFKQILSVSQHSTTSMLDSGLVFFHTIFFQCVDIMINNEEDFIENTNYIFESWTVSLDFLHEPLALRVTAWKAGPLLA